jgi:hypothetical protein
LERVKSFMVFEKVETDDRDGWMGDSLSHFGDVTAGDVAVAMSS